MIFKKGTNRYLLYVLIFFLLSHILLLMNTRFTLWPEMVVYPYLFNNGFLLYKDIINPYPPAFILFLSKFSTLFGYSPQPYQTLTWVTIIIIDVLIFIFATKLTKKILFGLLSSIFFILFSIPFGVNGLWFDLIQTPFILVSFFYFYKFMKNTRYFELFLSVLFVTFAFFIKQQAVWLAVWYLIVLIVSKKSIFKKIYTNYY